MLLESAMSGSGVPWGCDTGVGRTMDGNDGPVAASECQDLGEG